MNGLDKGKWRQASNGMQLADDLHRVQDMSVRAIALAIIDRVLEKGEHANQLLSLEASKGGLKGRDRAFLWELTLGVLRWLGRLDWILSSHIKGYQQLPPEVKNILRLSAYQLVFMDRVPPYSAVDEGVKLAKEQCPSKYHGLVNAVLRKVAGGPYPAVIGQRSALSALSIAYAHPLWLVKRWRLRMEMLDLLQLVRCNNTPAPFSVWVNTHLVDLPYLRKELKAMGIESKPHPFMEEVIIILTPVDITRLPFFKSGLIHPQDPASALVIKVLDPRAGEKVLDACAAPGIKTVQAAWAMENQGEVLACEVDPYRFRVLKETCDRSGSTIISAMLGDAVEVAGKWAPFQRILLDAPCTDLGTIRRHPEIKWRRREEDIRAFAKKQLRLLKNAIEALNPGGTLVYSVCSTEPEEGESLIDAILQHCPQLEPVDFRDRLPEALRPFYRRPGFLTLYPHHAGTDGFFIAKVRRT